jgi:hypothetical protein
VVAADAFAATQVGAGNDPSLAVDREGTTHLAWTQAREGSQSYLLHYCRIPRGARDCTNGAGPGVGQVFNPDTDLGAGSSTYDLWGPQVMITPFGDVFLLQHRYIANYPGTSVQNPNVLYHS